MKSIYREEVGPIVKILSEGIGERLKSNGGDEGDPTVGLLRFILDRVRTHRGDYIKIPPIPEEFLSSMDAEFVRGILAPQDEGQNFYKGVVQNSMNISLADIAGDEPNDIR